MDELISYLATLGQIALVFVCFLLYVALVGAVFEVFRFVWKVLRRFLWWLRSPRLCQNPKCRGPISWDRAEAVGLNKVETCSDKCSREHCQQLLIEAHKGQHVRGTGYRQHLPALIERQRGICGICGEALPPDWSQIHVDHITPKSRGGTDEPDNLQAAHEICNRRKGPRRMDELNGDLFRPPIKRRSI